jgi:hypothetical protein
MNAAKTARGRPLAGRGRRAQNRDHRLRETTMEFPRLIFAFALAAAAFAAQAADTVTDPNKPRALPADGPVSVSWSDPAQFSDIRLTHNRWRAEQGDWVQDLAKYVRKSAARQLQPGERVEVHIADIKRAGEYEPWRGPAMDGVRIIRDYYPPRLQLSYTLYGADGQVLAQAERKLSDLGFMTSSPPINDTDPLRYEKRMVDDWARRDLGPKREVGSR